MDTQTRYHHPRDNVPGPSRAAQPPVRRPRRVVRKESLRSRFVMRFTALMSLPWRWLSDLGTFRTIAEWLRKSTNPLIRFWNWLPPRMKWRKMLILWLIIQVVGFALHVVASIMLLDGDFGLTRLRDVPCNTLSVWKIFVIALPVNIIASLLNAGTSYARHVLLAPSRRNLDDKPLRSWDIGVPLPNNLAHVNWAKKVIWVALGITSLPLHMLFNSLFFIMPATYDAYQIIGSQSGFESNVPVQLRALMSHTNTDSSKIAFQRGPTYKPYLDDFPGLDYLESSISELQTHGSTTPGWESLSIKDCNKAYNSKFYQKYASVVLVINGTTPVINNNSATFMAALAGASYGSQSLIDYCPKEFLSAKNHTNLRQYTFKSDLSHLCDSYELGRSDMVIQHCFAQKTKEECTIVTSVLFWRIGAGLLGVQTLGMLATILLTTETPLLIVGDALSSFLQRPKNSHGRSHKSLHFSTMRMTIGLGGVIFLWFIAALAMGLTKNLRPGLTVPAIIDRTWLLALVSWTNLVQVATALLHYCEQCLVSERHARFELNSYSMKRRGLRLTQPVGGKQRSSYLLSVPFPNAMLLTLAGILLHWYLGILLSISVVYIYPVGSTVAHVQAANRATSLFGKVIPEVFENVKGKESTLGAIGLGLLLTVVPLIIHSALVSGAMNGQFSRNAVGSHKSAVLPNSASLSRACVPPEDEGDISEKALMYGIPVTQNPDAKPTFTSGELDTLVHWRRSRNPQPQHSTHRADESELVNLAARQEHV